MARKIEVHQPKILEGRKGKYIYNLEELLNDDNFQEGKKLEDWVYIQNEHGKRGLVSEQQFVRTEVLLLDRGVLLLTYKTIDATYSIIFRNHTEEAKHAANRYLSEVKEIKQGENFVTNILESSLVILNEAVETALWGNTF